jgi:O-acetyl-ADP-ribose deacetylase (regulator of RNase III)
MMHFTTGNLLDAKVEAVVNTVNTVGVMGKGIALMFKERFPKNYQEYLVASKSGAVQIGKMFVSATDELSGPKWVINFPTKKHWRNPSKIEWVREGLEALKEVIREKRITSIAIPPLGCGNGGLNWSNVRPLIQEYLNDLTDVEIIIYEPTEEYLNKPENP